MNAREGRITAKEGDKTPRSHVGKTYNSNFPTIQVSHGQFEPIQELRYQKCTYVDRDDTVVDFFNYAYATLVSGRYHIDRYSLKIPFGMFTKSKENGNVVLGWYEKKG